MYRIVSYYVLWNVFVASHKMPMHNPRSVATHIHYRQAISLRPSTGRLLSGLIGMASLFASSSEGQLLLADIRLSTVG